jgi:hypothetical protein
MLLYEQARELFEKGFWVVCVDEKTSIQARERTQTPDPAVPGQPVHISSRYKRQGALHLFGGLSVAELQEQIESHGWALSIQVYWLPKNAS